MWSEPLVFRVLKRLVWLLGMVGLAEPLLEGVFRLFPRVTPRLDAAAFAGYEPRPGDVFVCTYAKSGTNWMMQLCEQLAWHGRAEFEHIHHNVPWPDCPLPTMVRSLDEPPRSPTGLRVIKTHLPAGMVPIHPHARYIVVIRDPRDAFVSGYHFGHSVLGAVTPVSWSVERWMEAWVRGHTPYGSWARSTASWWELRDRPEVLVVSFEEMKRDLGGVVRKVASCVGLEPDKQVLSRVLERCEFAYMKERNAAFAPPLNPIGDHQMVMMRSGKVGEAGELLDAGQRARVLAHCRAELEALGSDFPLEERYPEAS